MQIKMLGRSPYLPTYEAMQAYTVGRQADSHDELWLCEHPPVFTQGLAGSADHLLAPGEIPVVQSNRGGQPTPCWTSGGPAISSKNTSIASKRR